MNQGILNGIIAAVAVVWPILITTLDRAYGRGEMKGKLDRIERDVAELRGLFVLTPAERISRPGV